MSLATLPQYEAYKDSGVAWLGKIPSSWNIRRSKFIFTQRTERARKNDVQLSATQAYGVIPQEEYERRIGRKVTKIQFHLDKRKHVELDDFVISMRSFQGGLERAYSTGCIRSSYVVLKPLTNVHPSYYTYLFKSQRYIEALQTTASFIRDGQDLNFDNFSKVDLVIPPCDIQKVIARFLDKKTTQIDEAIAIKQQQIELLKERKQIIIQQAVTRGLDPDVPMKDSGIEWIGEIPAHWKVKPLRYLGNTQNGISAGADYFGSGFPFVSYSNVYNNRQLPRTVKGLANSNEQEQAFYSVRAGDVFFTRTSETIEEIGFASTCFNTIESATFAGFLIRFRPTTNLLTTEFSKYYFNAPMMRDYFVKEMNLVIRASLSQELLKSLTVVLPPPTEQLKIFEHLENQSERIHKAIEVQREQIERLREYKTTLINSAVTGKIKVPQVTE